METHQQGTEEANGLHELVMDIVRATGLLQLDQIIHGQQISVSQAFALHELDTATPLSQRDLAVRLRLEKSSVSRMAAQMERLGLLTRERDPENHRQYRLRLTEHGRATHAQMRTSFHQQYEHWVAGMTPDERVALLTALPALLRVMHEHGCQSDQ